MCAVRSLIYVNIYYWFQVSYRRAHTFKELTAFEVITLMHTVNAKSIYSKFSLNGHGISKNLKNSLIIHKENTGNLNSSSGFKAFLCFVSSHAQ